MVSATTTIERPVRRQLESIRAVTSSRISQLAQSYILEGANAINAADLYLVNKTILNRIDVAGERGLTPRDIVLSLLRPALTSYGHCRCPSCQSRCLLCRNAST